MLSSSCNSPSMDVHQVGVGAFLKQDLDAAVLGRAFGVPASSHETQLR